MTTTNTEPGQLAGEPSVKLWHPADSDPFAQFVEDEDSETGFAPIDNAAEQAEASRTAPTYEVVARNLPGFYGDAWHIRINGQDFVVSAVSDPIFGERTAAFPGSTSDDLGDEVAEVRTCDHQAVIDELVAMAWDHDEDPIVREVEQAAAEQWDRDNAAEQATGTPALDVVGTVDLATGHATFYADTSPRDAVIRELRAMAAKFTESATSPIRSDEDPTVGLAVRHMYGKCAEELYARSNELAGGAR